MFFHGTWSFLEWGGGGCPLPLAIQSTLVVFPFQLHSLCPRSHSIADWAVCWRVAAPFQSVTGQICSRWDLSWVQLGFCPTHPFKPAKKNKLLDDRMHRLSMSTWPRRCHGARWRAHSTPLPYPTSKWAALVLSQTGPSGKVASPCNVDLSSLEGSGLVSMMGSTQMNLPSTKLWWIRWFT